MKKVVLGLIVVLLSAVNSQAAHVPSDVCAGSETSVAVGSLKLRSSTDRDDVAGWLKRGDKVKVTGKLDGIWYPVSTSKGAGFVAAWALAPVPCGKVVGEAKATLAPASYVASTSRVPHPVVTNSAAASLRDGNEAVAIKITELRVELLGVKRTAEQTQRDVAEIKVVVKSLKGLK